MAYTKNGKPHWLSPNAYLKWRFNSNFGGIRRRAKRKSLPFNLTVDYLISIFPKDFICPVLGVKMEFGSKSKSRNGSTETSPSLDRVVPELGYVEGNVIWVSSKANWMKSTGTVEELFAVAQFYQRLLHNPDLFLPGHTIH